MRNRCLLHVGAMILLGLLSACTRPAVLGLATTELGAPLKRTKGVIVLLHGYGAPGDDLKRLGSELLGAGLDGMTVVLPEGPYSAGRGRAWFKSPEDVEDARARITRLVKGIIKDARIKPEQLVIGGFSQGAMMAVDVALHLGKPVGGVAALSGKVLLEGAWPPGGGPRQRVFVAHGRSDAILPFSDGEALTEFLQRAGHDVEFFPFEGPHTIAPQVRQRLAGFIQERLAR